MRTKRWFLGVDRRTFQCLALGEEARLVASEDILEKTGRNLDRERKEINQRGIADGFQVD